MKNKVYTLFPTFSFFPAQETSSSTGFACEIEAGIMTYTSSQGSHCPGTKAQILLYLQTAWQIKDRPVRIPPQLTQTGKLFRNYTVPGSCTDRRQSSLAALSLLSVILKSIAQPDAQNNGCGLSCRTWPIWSRRKAASPASYRSGRSMLLHRGDLYLSTWPCYWGNQFHKSAHSEIKKKNTNFALRHIHFRFSLWALASLGLYSKVEAKERILLPW